MYLIDAIYYGAPLDDLERPSPEYQAYSDALNELMVQVEAAMGKEFAGRLLDGIAQRESTVSREMMRRGFRLSGRFWMELLGYTMG